MGGVITLGEALIDFIPLDNTNEVYTKSPGGAPANVAVAIAKLGGKSSFLGKVGEDVLGTFLKDTLNKNGVCTKHMYSTEEAKTGLTFVTLDEKGERSFSFYINPSADVFLNKEEIKEEHIKENSIFHFGSIALIKEPIKSATLKAINLAKENNLLISYDPNLRINLWDSKSVAKNTIISVLDKVDILKVSEEELDFITGEKDIKEGIKKLKVYNISLLLITLGEKGCGIYFKDEYKTIPSLKVQVVDTTGAGDAFMGGVLFNISRLNKDLNSINFDEVEYACRFSNICGALAVSKKGAMTALPKEEDVLNILKEL